MRNPSNRISVRRLFLLGAGASYAASLTDQKTYTAPLDNNFLERILRLNPERPHWVAQARRRFESQWKDHSALAGIGLEEAVVRHLGHLEFITAVHPRRTRNAITEFEWLNLLSHLVCYALRHTRETARKVYRQFAEKVFPDGTDVDAFTDRIVTFNYDDLLDRYFIERAGIERTYFDKLKRRRGDKSPRSVTFPNPLIIKLHGCINWRCEKAEFEGMVNGTFDDNPHTIEDIWYVKPAVPEPDDEFYPLIVPPLPVKPLTSIEIFQYLWTRAYEYLHSAEQLIICGYSLPLADRLAQSLFGNFANRRLKELVVVDPKPEIIEKWQALLRRKNVNSARLTYYEDFADYVDRMEVA
jgi:hypothetical protein